MANPFVHVELHTGDVAKAKAFYTKLFGWKLEDMPMPGGDTYTMIQVGEGTGGGMMSAQPPGSPPRWQAYVGVDDVAPAREAASSPLPDQQHPLVGRVAVTFELLEPNPLVCAQRPGVSYRHLGDDRIETAAQPLAVRPVEQVEDSATAIRLRNADLPHHVEAPLEDAQCFEALEHRLEHGNERSAFDRHHQRVAGQLGAVLRDDTRG